jgi:hypothetical protein
MGNDVKLGYWESGWILLLSGELSVFYLVRVKS